MNFGRVVFDSSAVVKLIVHEEGSDVASKIYRKSSWLAASRLMPLEIASALNRLETSGVLKGETLARIQFSKDTILPAFQLLSVDIVLALAEQLLQGSGALRSLDAIHLATAQTLSAPLVVFDRKLHRVAKKYGIPVLPQNL